MMERAVVLNLLVIVGRMRPEEQMDRKETSKVLKCDSGSCRLVQREKRWSGN